MRVYPDSAPRDAAALPSNFSACLVTRERLADGRRSAGAPWPRASARAALWREY
jgi:hypothetical protein